LKLSTRSRYGTRALLDLARHEAEAPVQLKDIARRQRISLAYLEHIIAPLVGAGIVRSLRGRRGGLKLTRRPERIRLSEVVHLLEGNATPVDCIAEPGCCDRTPYCAVRDIWSEMQQAIDDTLGAITLRELMERQKTKESGGPARPETPGIAQPGQK